MEIDSISAGNSSGVLRGGALGTNKGYVLAHCPPQDQRFATFLRIKFSKIFHISSPTNFSMNSYV